MCRLDTYLKLLLQNFRSISSLILNYKSGGWGISLISLTSMSDVTTSVPTAVATKPDASDVEARRPRGRKAENIRTPGSEVLSFSGRLRKENRM